MFDKGVLRFYHGGVFNHVPRVEYKSARVKDVGGIDPDLIDYFDLLERAKDAGNYSEVDELYFWPKGTQLENGLVLVNGDNEVRAISVEMGRHGEASIFVIGRKFSGGRPKMTARKRTYLVGNSNANTCPTTLTHSSVTDLNKGNIPSPRDSPPTTRSRAANVDSPPPQPDPSPLKGAKTISTPARTPQKYHNSHPYPCSPTTRSQSRRLASTSEVEVLPRNVDEIDDRPDSPITLDHLIGNVVRDVENEGDAEGNDSGEDSDGEPDVGEDVLGYDLDTSDDECVEARKELDVAEKRRILRQKIVEKEFVSGGGVGDGGGVGEGDGLREYIIAGAGEEHYDDSDDEVVTTHTSDDEGDGILRRRNKVAFDHRTDFNKLKWVPGMRFKNREHFRDCVIRYGVAQGRDVRFKQSNINRNQQLGVGCCGDCPFKLWASMEAKHGSFLLKTVHDTHTCMRDMSSNTQLKARWMAKEFLEVFKVRPHWPAKEIVEAYATWFRGCLFSM